jgi:hypothetical protein
MRSAVLTFMAILPANDTGLVVTAPLLFLRHLFVKLRQMQKSSMALNHKSTAAKIKFCANGPANFDATNREA